MSKERTDKLAEVLIISNKNSCGFGYNYRLLLDKDGNHCGSSDILRVQSRGIPDNNTYLTENSEDAEIITDILQKDMLNVPNFNSVVMKTLVGSQTNTGYHQKKLKIPFYNSK